MEILGKICSYLREGSQVQIVVFFVAYLPELATDPNTKNM